ncbi:predicted protein, partial [Nematostella vectensis]
IEPVIFLYVYGILMHGPVIQQFVYSKIAKQKGFFYDPSSHTGCGNETRYNSTLHNLEQEVQATAAYVQIGITMFESLPSIVLSLMVGSWSDCHGRKPAILLPVIGSMLEAVCVLIVMYCDLDVYVLFIGALLNGCSGYLPTLLMGIMAYIADSTDESQRALRLAIMEALVFTGGMVSQLTSGLWIDKLGFTGPYWFIFGCLVIAFFYTIFLVPETRFPDENTEKSRFFSCKTLKRIWKVYSTPRDGGRKNMLLLTLNDALTQVAIQGVGPVMTLYILHSPLCFSADDLGYFSAVRFLVMGFGAVFGLKFLVKWIDELSISRLGLLTTIGTYVLFGFSTTRAMVFIVGAVGLLNGAVAPVFKGMLSRIVSRDEQGALFSFVASLETLCSFIGALTLSSMYPAFLKHDLPGMVFFLVAIVSLIPLLV